MHREEADRLVACADCGASIDPGRDRGFVSAGGALCFDCSLRRGGEWDGDRERWSTEPSASGLRPEDA